MFQSTRPHGARPVSSAFFSALRLFQSTRPHGARHRAAGLSLRGWPVSIHAPARGATSQPRIHSIFPAGFNPRARTGRDLGKTSSANRLRLFQSTRPHGARLHEVDDGVLHAIVSIHAPARGATRRSGTRPKPPPFQSTRPHGARQGLPWRQAKHRGVSIHAPARGATCPGQFFDACQARFNPRARTGRDYFSTVELERSRCFNPRARTGRDAQLPHQHPAQARVSIHAPARGATLGGGGLTVDQGVSIHAPARGATWIEHESIERLIVSIHAPARGATLIHGHFSRIGDVSIHAPARGATAGGHYRARPTARFNPRARTGRDSSEMPIQHWTKRFNPRARTGRDLM